MAIAEAIYSDSGADTTVVLLKLLDVLEGGSLDAKSLCKARNVVWESDLIHIMVEVLRQDFSATEGQWHTAAQLARLLADICASLKPVVSSRDQDAANDSREEQVKEYYDLLLPTAVDSLLILAHNMYENDQQKGLAPVASSDALRNVHTVLNALVWLCSSHKLCANRSIQSPYLLHLLISDEPLYSLAVMSAIENLVQKEHLLISNMALEVLQSILDELVYKMGSLNKKVALLAIRLLALCAHHHAPIVDMLHQRNKGLSILLRKYESQHLDPLVQEFVVKIGKCTMSDEERKLYQAATLIQAGWKGYITRKKLQSMKSGIRKFQQLYRKRQAECQKKKATTSTHLLITLRQRTEERESLRQHHEDQITTLGKMPASAVNEYLTCEQGRAAVVVQSWWKGVLARKKVAQLKRSAEREKSAVVIQRATRKHLHGHKLVGQQESRNTSLAVPAPTADERRRLAIDAACFRECHQLGCKSQQQLVEQQQAVSDIIKEYETSRHHQQQLDRRREFLISEVCLCYPK